VSSQRLSELPVVVRGSWDARRGLPSAPDRAETLPQAPQPGWGDLQDQAAVYSAVRCMPGLTQRALFEQLVPVMARKRVQAAAEAGVRSGRLVESPGSRGSRTWRTSESPEFDGHVVEQLVSALEVLQGAGAMLNSCHRHRLGLLFRGAPRNEVGRAGSVLSAEAVT